MATSITLILTSDNLIDHFEDESSQSWQEKPLQNFAQYFKSDCLTPKRNEHKLMVITKEN